MTETETLVERRRRQARERKRKQRARERGELPPARATDPAPGPLVLSVPLPEDAGPRDRLEALSRMINQRIAAGVDSAAELASLGRAASGLQDDLGEIAIADLTLPASSRICSSRRSFRRRSRRGYRTAEAGIRMIVEGVRDGR